ncbi:PREDICTED: uncharacterized protein LOC104704481 [Camelina sativa]|uniref:Uncharacterized protein LOC104704481 n=1 Tax=Camelina sativa TaxID=90675 RepID=A0ABM0T0E6_CAMSA|nr:PREDICTED: uncharacterized protein LOC104704481 [Camelina sativa]
MDQSSEKPKFNLRLLIDEKKNKVVMAEADMDFVDVLCGLLTLPMGTIVRLLEKHQNPQSFTVGCFTNLYKSVSDMSVDNFETQACKDLLLYPRSLKESHCRRLKLNLDDTESTKFFVYPRFVLGKSCSKVYSNICNSLCSCGKLMNREVQIEEEDQDEGDGVFLSCRSSFIITDDLKLVFNSIGNVMSVLNDLGYDGFDKLQERLLEVGSDEVMTLIECLFNSDTPLTDTFLRGNCVSRKQKFWAPLVQESIVAGPQTLKVFVRKVDRVILYAECREEFVDFLFSFLAIPIEFVGKFCSDNANISCIGNLCRSVKGLSLEEEGDTTVTNCVLPHFYNCRAQLLDVVIQEVPEYECLVTRLFCSQYNASKLCKRIEKNNLLSDQKIVKLSPMNPKSKGTSDSLGIGFVKGKTNFMVSDDLHVTAMNSSSTISMLSKLQVNINDIEEQVISIGKAEAISLLRASLVTTSALTNGLSKFLPNGKRKNATHQSTFKILKIESTR